MAKTKYQEAATAYVREYLERLLKKQDMTGRDTEARNDLPNYSINN